MKKRIVCVLLTLIMLMSLVPVNAFAASRSISESAITILKQLEGYSTTCKVNGKTRTFGYGTICTVKKDHTTHTEKEADAALREALKDLDKAVNSFATKKGISLSQSKHDALVLFSFQNGTAWTNGTGDFQSAIVSGKTGTEFLNAICRWNTANTISTDDPLDDDDNRRMIEANMYLNGVYSSTRPSTYICVTYDATSGSISETANQYYDVSNKPAPHLVPTREGHTFTGWLLMDTTKNVRNTVTNLTAEHHGATLIAGWVGDGESVTPLNPTNLAYPHMIQHNQLTSGYVFTYNTGKKAFEVYTSANVKSVQYFYLKDTTTLEINALYRDENGQLWGRLVDHGYAFEYWIAISGTGSSSFVSSNVAYIDVTVTVTNSRVNMRANASVTSKLLGSFSKGDQLRIINTENGSGMLWGQVATSAYDNTPIGWVPLMYTNFDAVRDNPTASKPVNNSTAIATAIIKDEYNYVNVRSEAGTDNKIVGALSKGTEVSLYEVKYVNGQAWGRCNVGWFCLNYAKVDKDVSNKNNIADAGFASYVFTGKLNNQMSLTFYKSPSASAAAVDLKDVFDDEKITIKDVDTVTISNLVSADGFTWGKCSWSKYTLGWIRVTNNADYQAVDVKLDPAKYLVSADSLTARVNPGTDAARKDTLVKNVEFNVNETNQVFVLGDSVWGFATKVGEQIKEYGWVNLANKYVTRNGAPSLNLGSGSDETAGPILMAKVINSNSVKVRVTGATYGKQIGTLKLGTTAAVLEENNGWYNLDIDVDGNPETGSWVSGQYLDIYQTTAGSSTSTGNTGSGSTSGAAVETGMGIVANTYSGVNVRTGAGTGYGASGKLLPGTAIEILEVVDKGTAKWGRTVQGWVCMDYITMVSNYPIAGSTAGNNTGSNNATGNTTVTSEPAIYTGTISADSVNVRKTTSLDSEIVRILTKGAPITLHEILTVQEEVKTETPTNDNKGTETVTTKTTSYWARVNDGYIYAPGNHINLDTVDEHVYTLTDNDTLNVRNQPGTSGTSVLFKLKKGDQVKVTQLRIVNSGVWGFIECDKGTGWASLLYMTKGTITIQPEVETPNTNTGTGNVTGGTTNTTPNLGIGSNVGGFVTNTSGYRYTGKVINTNTVNVRATASTSASVTTQLKYGQSLVIYETVTSENMAWGRCDAGWVYLYYVDLTPVVNGAVDARVVYNDNTVVYTDASGSATTGQTYARMSVIDIFEIVGKMARTELGWVNTDNLL